MFYIYALENLQNHKLYIGVTSETPKQRFQRHVNLSKRDKGYTIQQAIRKYGRDSFEVIILTTASDAQSAFELEKKYIQWFDTCEGVGYNDTIGGLGVVNLHSTEYGKSEFTEKEVFSLRKRFVEEQPLSTYEMAEKLDVTAKGLHSMLVGDTYSDIEVPDGMEAAMRIRNEGSNSPVAKLSESDVIKIRNKYANGKATQKDLAKQFDVSSHQISRIVRGKRWKSAGGPISKNNTGGFSKEEVREICDRYEEEDILQRELANEYDTSQQTVSSMVNGDYF